MTGLFSGIISQVMEKRLSLTNYGEWVELGMAGRSASGVSVTEEQSMKNTAVFAAVRVLAETVASLPLILYERLPNGGKQRAVEHTLHRLLHDMPNPEMTAYNLRETLMGQLVLWGNCYAEIEYDAGGRIRYLWPLRADMMHQVTRDPATRRLIYVYELTEPAGKIVTLPMERVFHVRGLASDGRVGYSPIALARNAVGLALATEEYGSRLFANGAQPKVVLEHPGKLGEEAHKRLRESWESRHMGLENAHRTAILEEGMKIETIGMPPEDAQFLQTRKFQVNEIARLFRVPPHLLMDLERSTFSNIEHQGIEFVTHSLRPWLVNWEQEIYRSLLLERERVKYFAEHLVDGLLRGDISSRYQAYATARQNGWLSANDIRRIENMNPVSGGDAYLVPLNMVEAGGTRGESGEVRVVPTPPSPPSLKGVGELADAKTGVKRETMTRHKLQQAEVAVMSETAGRILRRERNDVSAQAKKLLGKRLIREFELWVADFYDAHAAWSAEQMLPVMESYARQVAALVEDELDEPADPELLKEFIKEYAQSFGLREATRSHYWIRERLQKALAGTDDLVEQVDELLDGWVENRGENIAREESTRENNAVTKQLYVLSGVMALRWVSFGENCPYCSQLNGKTVGIAEYFMSANDEIGPEENKYKAARNYGHPPLHDGCDCMIQAG